MKPITFDVQYWTDRPLERITCDDPEQAIEDLKNLILQEDVQGVQMTVEKQYRHERGY